MPLFLPNLHTKKTTTDFYRMNGRNLSDLCYIIGSQWSISFEKIKAGSVLIVIMTVYVSERDGPKKR